MTVDTAGIGAGERKTLYQFGYRRSADQDAGAPARHPVVIVGAGPVGMSLAIDLAQRGQKVVIVDDADRIGEGSRAICFAKRTLEIWDRLGVGKPMVETGVTWRVGKNFLRDKLVYQFDLLPEDGHKMPAFINLQQYYAELFLVERIAEIPDIDLRWRNKVTMVEQRGDHVRVTLETPDGPFELDADWLIACDGAKSPLRGMLGIAFDGQVFEDRFLIADVKMTADFPSERWFWFDPPFHAGQSALLHKQPDDIWRIDLQLGWEADQVEEQKPENVVPRIERMLGHSNFELEWVSLYTFQCRRIAGFVHDRVIFAGDSAHQVSPFGARGANSGVQDAENLAWKLDLVIRGQAAKALLESYDLERSAAADENIAHSTRSTDFIAPKTPMERRLRNAVLDLAAKTPFARDMVNSGRLSTPTVYRDTPLSTPDAKPFAGSARLGAPVPDCPMTTASGDAVWLLRALGPGFTVLHVAGGEAPEPVPGAALIVVGRDLMDDVAGHFAKRYDATPGATYLIRPDQHLAARFRSYDPDMLGAAMARACAAGA
ncbi:FAD-dependent oxidoreductase [Breoghania sp. L-A4]|uniref:FAD-dependent oxidoreductase n=1 Tax=Breoghania sp. L-A4 TaxID=2304600 RepID=UPI000E35E853|nr:FAD-dependent oxidoreductase [Breoghania sp. L-A4]AXS40322.1 FAD-dependent oxidoreductase [Breoghania sp. L-A4]